MSDNQVLLDPKGIAKYLGFHEMTVYRFLREGTIPAKKVNGRWVASTESLDKWLMDKSPE